MQHRMQTMPRKLFIGDLGNERKYRALKGALANESDVEIFYDRRDGSRASAWRGEERRRDSDVPERIRRDGFAVTGPTARGARAQISAGRSRALRAAGASDVELASAIAGLKAPTLILDGEVCMFDKGLISEFHLLDRGVADEPCTPPVFMAFDCLNVHGLGVRGLPLPRRRRSSTKSPRRRIGRRARVARDVLMPDQLDSQE